MEKEREREKERKKWKRKTERKEKAEKERQRERKKRKKKDGGREELEYQLIFNPPLEAGLLNKSSCLAAPLGGT
jgi:hypothetical protein